MDLKRLENILRGTNRVARVRGRTEFFFLVSTLDPTFYKVQVELPQDPDWRVYPVEVFEEGTEISHILTSLSAK
jgi:hypothetical protein